MKWYHYILTTALAFAGYSAVFPLSIEPPIGGAIESIETQAMQLKPEESLLKTTELTKLNAVSSEFDTKQKYVQVINGKVANTGETLTTKLPTNMSINVHDGPDGKGYSVVTTYADKVISVGYGAYANENTWTQITTLTASST